MLAHANGEVSVPCAKPDTQRRAGQRDRATATTLHNRMMCTQGSAHGFSHSRFIWQVRDTSRARTYEAPKTAPHNSYARPSALPDPPLTASAMSLTLYCKRTGGGGQEGERACWATKDTQHNASRPAQALLSGPRKPSQRQRMGAWCTVQGRTGACTPPGRSPAYLAPSGRLINAQRHVAFGCL